MPADDVRLKLLLYGDSGTGKTWTASTAPVPCSVLLTEPNGLPNDPEPRALDAVVVQADEGHGGMDTVRAFLRAAKDGTLQRETGAQTVVLDSLDELQRMIRDEIMAGKRGTRSEAPHAAGLGRAHRPCMRWCVPSATCPCTWWRSRTPTCRWTTAACATCSRSSRPCPTRSRGYFSGGGPAVPRAQAGRRQQPRDGAPRAAHRTPHRAQGAARSGPRGAVRPAAVAEQAGNYDSSQPAQVATEAADPSTPNTRTRRRSR